MNNNLTCCRSIIHHWKYVEVDQGWWELGTIRLRDYIPYVAREGQTPRHRHTFGWSHVGSYTSQKRTQVKQVCIYILAASFYIFFWYHHFKTWTHVLHTSIIYVCRIPREAFHAEPTTFLLSIEGMPGLDWKRLRKLQCPDGSYMSSPAPTAYALMQTGDAKCFEFLDKLIDKFNGGGMDRRAHKMMTRNYFPCSFYMTFVSLH